jgi:hypothetical protein
MNGKLIMILALLPSLATADIKPIWSSNTYQRTEIKYNPYTHTRELTTSNSTIQYNPYTQQRQYVPNIPAYMLHQGKK